jgi:hypothetical protein
LIICTKNCQKLKANSLNFPLYFADFLARKKLDKMAKKERLCLIFSSIFSQFFIRERVHKMEKTEDYPLNVPSFLTDFVVAKNVG